jgi:ATP-binding cassette subfamily C (CFTR/MRP) protein 5
MAAFLQSVSATITPMINIVSSMATFLAYSLSGNNLTPAEAFTLFSVFSAMTFTFGTLPFALRAIGEASVCFRNFQKFLDLPEFEIVTEQDMECDHDTVVAIKDGNFAWEIENLTDNPKEVPKKNKKSKKKARNDNKSKPNGSNNGITSNDSATNPEEQTLSTIDETKEEEIVLLEECLKNINLEIKRGSLLGVSGSVGSGKSSLISSILGELVKTKGKMLIRGSVAVVPQQAWIYSDTLQENILFGSPMNKQKYDKVLDICSLRNDIASFGNGDLTIVGERGVTLSGGQKARLNVARAVYADKSIYRK